MTPEEVQALEDELETELKVCCGPTSDVLDHIRKTLQLLVSRSNACSGPMNTYLALCDEVDTHLGLNTRMAVGYVYLYHLEALDMIEHGSGIRGSWPTQKGKDILAKLETWAAARSTK